MYRLRNWRRLTAGEDSGFALAEIIVALFVIGLAAAASTPLLISGLDASITAQMNTQAKNFAQQRIESMRDLQFHVDRQNGPFIDLLDVYYTDRGTTPATRTRANEIEVGQWVSGGASAPAPSGPVYKVSVAQLPANSVFSQTIYTQFLDATGAVLPASTFTTYDSQSEGHDQPPSGMVGVTVVTTWTRAGLSHSYTSYTRITDSRGEPASLTSQGSGSFLRLSGTGSAGNSLSVDLAATVAGGALSTGSLATADVRALQATDAAGQSYLGATAVATSPSGGNTQSSPVSSFVANDGSSCGWVSAGVTQVADVSAATVSGLPQVPSDIDANLPPTHQATAQLTGGGGATCGSFGFGNQSASYDDRLMLASDIPLVRIADASQNTIIASGSAWVNATTAVGTSTHSVTAGASASATKRVQLFPGAGFVTDGFGVVDVQLTSSSITCSSSAATNGLVTDSSTGSWSATIDYWHATDLLGHGQRVTLGTYTWNSATGSGSADPLASVDPSTIVVYQNGTTILRLSDYIASWTSARSIVENPNSGLHQLNGIVSITTQPVRSGDMLSTVGAQIGNLSCVADDGR